MKTITYEKDGTTVELKTLSNIQTFTLESTDAMQDGMKVAVNFCSLFVSGSNIPDEFGETILDFDPKKGDHGERLDLDFAARAIRHAIEKSRLARKEAKNSG